MRPKILLLSFFLWFSMPLWASYDSLFFDYSLRIDYIRSGTASSEHVALNKMLSEPFWAGSRTMLIDTFFYGNYKVEVFDTTGTLMYSRGYSSLFAEWQTTLEAAERTKSFEESVLIPFPKKPVKLVLSSRLRNGQFESRLQLDIQPDDYFIRPTRRPQYEVFDVMVHTTTDKAVDIVLLPDGYTADQMQLFRDDSRQFVEQLFSFEPFASQRERFNVRAILAPSADSGIAIPAAGFWPETVLSSSFYTFDSERYCMSEDHYTIRDLAAHAPYDQIYILANTEKYGGGGIFNFYCLSSARNRQAAAIIVHEFGHGFAGLGDEYYDSSTAYNDFYPLDVEPWEPNITTLIDFDRKWNKLIHEDTPVPTPDTEDWTDVTGVFEGGGYSAKGIYRPSRDCLMHTFKGNVFCAACNEAILKMIDFYTQ